MSRLLCQAELHRLGRHIRRASRPAAYWLKATHDNELAVAVDLDHDLMSAGPSSPFTESNRRPSPYHGDALPTELKGRCSRGSHVTRWRAGCGKQVDGLHRPPPCGAPHHLPRLPRPLPAPNATPCPPRRGSRSRVAGGRAQGAGRGVVPAAGGTSPEHRASGQIRVERWLRFGSRYVAALSPTWAEPGAGVRHAGGRVGLEVAAPRGPHVHPLGRETSRHSD